MAMTLKIKDAAHWWGLDDFASTSPDSDAWGYAQAWRQSWGDGLLDIGESGYVTSSYAGGLETETDLVGADAWTDTITGVALYGGTTLLWDMQGAVDVAAGSVGAGVDEAVLLEGDDDITGNGWNNKLEGYDGDDFIEGGGGTDTAVFAGSLYEYGYGRDGSVVRTWGPDGNDTLLGMERLEFDDYGVAFDTAGAAGQAYRLYQATFDRTPDLGGLGYHIAALDGGLTLWQVADNFLYSPEFQWRYGSLDNAQFVTQLYANVLDRAPDPGGFNWHMRNLDAGMSRAHVLVTFSESAENQVNVIGQIDDGMVYVPYM